MLKLEKSQTGIASEFYVAGELSRRGYNVTLTLGNTKAIDLLVQKGIDIFQIQVKGIQRTKSICWNIDKTKINDDIYYVLVNLHADQPAEKPEFFLLTGQDTRKLFKPTTKADEKWAYLDYGTLKKLSIYKDRWDVFGKPEMVLKDPKTWEAGKNKPDRSK